MSAFNSRIGLCPASTVAFEMLFFLNDVFVRAGEVSMKTSVLCLVNAIVLMISLDRFQH